MSARRTLRHRPGCAVALLLVAAALGVGCHREPRPSILLIVLDTTRYDALSMNGVTSGTSPHVDELAAQGLRYTRAYAQANWTVPSHATLFTGLYPHQHGVVGTRSRLPDELPTLAERLRGAGYQTMAVSENPWINEQNGLARGFDHSAFVLPRVDLDGAEVRDWIRTHLTTRQPDRPVFLFVNLMDAHWPYLVRDQNPFLPAGVDRAAAAAVSQDPPHYLCRDEPRDRELAILRGLYLGGVAAADRKAGRVREDVLAHGVAPMITILASDHGEHFGEHRMVGHDYGVREPLIHVPLVVHGLPDVAPAVIGDPVQLADIVPSILSWIGLPVPTDLAGSPLPTRQGSRRRPSAALAEYTELKDREKVEIPDTLPDAVKRLIVTRETCRPDEHVFGDTQALVQYPMKMFRYADGSSALYDLAADPGERHDCGQEHLGTLAELQQLLAARVDATPRRASAGSQTLDPALAERLRALGYAIDGSTRPNLPPGGRPETHGRDGDRTQP